jgi:glycosyltransferase involved in cell wall biosynthesis
VNDVRVAIIAPRVLEPYLGPSAVAHNTLRGFLKIQSELEKRNIEIVFLSINGEKTQNFGNIRVENIRFPPLTTLFAELRFILNRMEENPDIIHSYGFYDIFPWLLKKDVAKIFHLHGIVWKEKKYYNTLGKFFAWLYEKRLPIYYPRFNKVIAISSYVIEELSRKGFDTSKAVLIENPVGDEFFEVKKNEERIILYPAVLNPRKNQLGFLKALAIVKNEIGDFKVVFTGSGDKAYVEKLKDFVKKENLNVGFAGRVPYGKMPELYSKASIVALCSFQETTPMAIAEAMASGTAVLASNIGGVPHMIDNSRSGVIVDPNNPRDIAENLLMLIEDEKLRKKLGENARRDAEKRWRSDVIARKLLELYFDVLNEI